MTHGEFETFYGQTSRQLWAYLLRITNNRETANDILQESYLRFLEKPPDGREFAQMKSYLYTIATRLNLDRVGKIRRRWQKLTTFFEENKIPGHDVQADIHLQVDMSAVFDRLKPRERALLWLAYVEEQPHSAIAQILGMREKSVKVVLYRARRKLAGLLERCGYSEVGKVGDG